MRCTVIHSKTCRYPYNFIYKTVLVDATTYSKIKVLTSILLKKMKIVKFDKIVKKNFSCYILVI